MKSMKKSVIAVLVIGAMSVAGTALAGSSHGRGQMGPEPGWARPMKMQQWNGNNLPPAGPGGPCFCGQRGPMEWQPGQGFGHRGGPAFGPEACGPWGPQFQRRGCFSPDMPQEVRDKAVEAAKLRIDLENVLSQRPLNREKAIELNGQIGKLNQEIRAWHFEQELNRVEELSKRPVERPAEAAQEK